MSTYSYSTGELVLETARHYGWSGTNVKITYKMPTDAPTSAKTLSYPDVLLPYHELAGAHFTSSRGVCRASGWGIGLTNHH